MEGTNLLPLSSPPLFQTPFPLETITNYSSIPPARSKCSACVFPNLSALPPAGEGRPRNLLWIPNRKAAASPSPEDELPARQGQAS